MLSTENGSQWAQSLVLPVVSMWLTFLPFLRYHLPCLVLLLYKGGHLSRGSTVLT